MVSPSSCCLICAPIFLPMTASNYSSRRVCVSTIVVFVRKTASREVMLLLTRLLSAAGPMPSYCSALRSPPTSCSSTRAPSPQVRCWRARSSLCVHSRSCAFLRMGANSVLVSLLLGSVVWGLLLGSVVWGLLL